MAVIPPHLHESTCYFNEEALMTIHEGQGEELVEFDEFEDDFEDVLEEDDVPYEDYQAVYFERIKRLYNEIPIQSPADFEIVRRSLENLLVPSCEFLIMHAHLVPKNIQDAMNAISLHMAHPEVFVECTSHVEQYLLTLENGVTRSLAQLSMFAETHATREQERVERELVEHIAEEEHALRESAKFQQEVQENLIRIVHNASSYELELLRFLLTFKALKDGTHDETISPVSAALLKAQYQQISEKQLVSLSKAQLNRLIFDGNSAEALAIIDGLTESSIPKLAM